MMLLFYLLAVR